MRKKKIETMDVLIHIFFIIVCCCFVFPLIMVISASFSEEDAILTQGFSLIPRGFTLEAYKSCFYNVERMIRAYGVTIFQAVVGTVSSTLVASMIAYPLSRSNFKYRRVLTWFVIFTMLIGPSMIPCYIIYSKFYHISNTMWMYILPGITGGAWNTLVLRTFFTSISESLYESARIEGASELTIFRKIALPLSKPALASVGFLTLVAKWNDYTTSMIYIRDENLYTLQYLLQRLNSEAAFLKSLSSNLGQMGNISLDSVSTLPSETLKFAMCVIAAGPMLAIFPFFQKYFEKGLTIGAVKG